MATRPDTSLWHPFADMAAVRGNELVLTRGEGVWLWDEDGNRYLDGSASLWYCNVGHGRAEIADAVAAQMKELEAWSVFGDAATPPALELAARLSALSSLDEAKVFFTTGGGDAIDTAAKLVRLYWQVLGQPERLHIVSRARAYHGTMAFGTSIGGIEANRVGYGPLVPSTSQVPWDSPDALRDEIERLGAERVAAFFVEPVIGAGGVLPPPEGYVEAVAEICRDAAVLFVCDSVICGFGRLGTWFGFERFGIEPDLVTFAKGVTSGYLPLGGVVVSARVAEPFWSEPGRVVRHGQTYSGHAAACTAGLVNIDILERESLVERGRELEDELLATLSPLADHPLVGEVRGGTGLLTGIALHPDALAEDPGLTAKAYKAIRPHGVILRALGDALAVSPPLTISSEEIELIRDAVRAGLDDLAFSRDGAPEASQRSRA
jgi:putrescine aminotransferase